MGALAEHNKANLIVGDKVEFYCQTNMCTRMGTITAVDVEITHQWHYQTQSGRVMVSSRDGKPRPNAYHPFGVEVDGSLTFSYSEAPRKV